MIDVYPELEHDVKRRKLVFSMLDMFPSLRQDVEMYLAEGYSKELREVVKNIIQIQEIKMGEREQTVNDALDQYTKSRSDGLHSGD